MNLEQIAIYLPYNLQILHSRTESDFTEKITATCEMIDYIISNTSKYDVFKPMLRPISDLKNGVKSQHGKVILWEIFNEAVKPFELFENITNSLDLNDAIEGLSVHELPYGVVNLLAKYHFDIWGLIPQGLAVSFSSIS